MEASKCPKCGEEPFYIEHVEKWYCYGCNSYIEEQEHEHVCVPASDAKVIEEEIQSLDQDSKLECKKCGAVLEGLKDGKLYCFMCETYQDELEKKPPEMCSDKPPANEAQELIDGAVPAPVVEREPEITISEAAVAAMAVMEKAPVIAPVVPLVEMKKEEPHDVRMCSVCGQPLKYIEKYSRYYCYGCRKYAPRDDMVKDVPPARTAIAKRQCPDCGGQLKFIEKYNAHYCYSCKRYPLRTGKKAKAAAGYQATRSRPLPCPRCGGPLKYVEKYSRHYCDECREYAPKGHGVHSPRSGEKKSCPACHRPMKFIAEYGEWYCYECKKYALRPSKPVLLV